MGETFNSTWKSDPAYLLDPDWLDTGDNAWQLTAASLVGLQSIPGLMVLYAGLVKKKWVSKDALSRLTLHDNDRGYVES